MNLLLLRGCTVKTGSEDILIAEGSWWDPLQLETLEKQPWMVVQHYTTVFCKTLKWQNWACLLLFKTYTNNPSCSHPKRQKASKMHCSQLTGLLAGWGIWEYELCRAHSCCHNSFSPAVMQRSVTKYPAFPSNSALCNIQVSLLKGSTA